MAPRAFSCYISFGSFGKTGQIHCTSWKYTTTMKRTTNFYMGWATLIFTIWHWQPSLVPQPFLETRSSSQKKAPQTIFWAKKAPQTICCKKAPEAICLQKSTSNYVNIKQSLVTLPFLPLGHLINLKLFEDQNKQTSNIAAEVIFADDHSQGLGNYICTLQYPLPNP